MLIEPAPSHRLYQHTFRTVLARFKPDLLFQIDHLRYEHGDMFPPNLPFACWVQDHMAHLKEPKAAQSVTTNDFVLTDAGPVYSATFGYPRRQIVGLTKLTRVPASLPHEEAGGDDLVFVSNASHVPLECLRAAVGAYDGTAGGRAVMSLAGQRLIAIYAAGGCVATWMDVLALAKGVRDELRLRIDPAEVELVAGWLFHPLNDSLYRQQALTWVADIADELGLKLALYGKGWERHPRFAAYARGPVAYGADLERLTRSSRINLQIVPYLCLHQRLLDGLVAGGFYLIRRHTTDTEVGALLSFLDAHVGPAGIDLPSARALVAGDYRDELERLAQACRPALATSDADDVVAIARHWEEMKLVQPGRSVLPGFEETSFSDAAGFRQGIERFLADPGAREAVRGRQRASVVERFSYETGIRRVLGRIGQLLGETAAADVRTAEREAA